MKFGAWGSCLHYFRNQGEETKQEPKEHWFNGAQVRALKSFRGDGRQKASWKATMLREEAGQQSQEARGICEQAGSLARTLQRKHVWCPCRSG